MLTKKIVMAAMMDMALDADEGLVREVPHGSNWGNAVAEILRLASFGQVNFPTNWCAASITNYLILNGAKKVDLPTVPIRVREWSEWANKNSIWAADPRIAERGDLFLYRKPKWTGAVGHIGWILENHEGRYLRTVEGNLHNKLARYGEQGSDYHTWRPVKEGFEIVRLSRLA